MRIVRNFAILAVLLSAPVLAQRLNAAEAAGPTCGDCTCSDGQCCSKSWTGSCKCTTCPVT